MFDIGDLIMLRTGELGIVINILDNSHPENPQNQIEPTVSDWEIVTNCSWVKIYSKKGIEMHPEHSIGKL